MKRITGLMKNICTMKNALIAYQKARRCKRYRPEVLEFEANREEYLSKAIRELESLTYTPGKYKVFKVWEPKERIIMALPFYDRVIQHMIVNYIENRYLSISSSTIPTLAEKGKVLTEPASS